MYVINARANLAAILFAFAAPGIGSAYAETQTFDPNTFKLSTLIECRADDIGDYYSFVSWLKDRDTRPADMEALGLTATPTDNPMIEEYRLSKPITVFERSTDRIALTSAGLMGVFDEADPHPLAKQLGVTAALDVPGKFLGERVIKESEHRAADDPSFVTRYRISLDVSTVTSHPRKTLAGCTYRMSMEDK
ncbi:hypothetical protein P3W85_24390 [Cupriavidus basilensis]|uniref:Uncharacterized protein n=1 Tax=Cupriavidus basilensis TaxID=68895 RepID=A0ABT6AUW4_9BURK|nr:hypothetical protein [Cupriavidus basilensis]MDF3836067.1 hypothetical protein [Cupriavidus basilensis]